MNEWRFPRSNYGQINGISNANTETFKKTPYKSFAREVIQNSIDARLDESEPVRVEFSVFDLDTKLIPGLNELKMQAARCQKYAEDKLSIDEYENILKILQKKNIKCLKISDYNTTGLIGVESRKNENNKFIALARGSGVSKKTSTMAAGSKGTGKNAVFLMSEVKTIFYSTLCNESLEGIKEKHCGHIGVANFISGYICDEDINKVGVDCTAGTGYFSSSEQNDAVKSCLNLDNKSKNRNCSGTDIYVLAFLAGENWEREVLNSILDSFIVAIYMQHLEVIINDIEISKNTLKNIVYDEYLIEEKEKANIISQYRLISGTGQVKAYDIETGYEPCTLYILPYEEKEFSLATHRCTMIRHPLMKIKNEELGSNFNCSAMCVIGEGFLGEELRKIENPKHDDWEFERIRDNSLKKELYNEYKNIRKAIKEYVIECLRLGDNEPIDPSGAAEFLPDEDESVSNNGKNYVFSDSVESWVSEIKDSVFIEKNPEEKNEDGSSIQPDIGGIDDLYPGDIQHPSGHNQIQGNEYHSGDNEAQKISGDGVLFEKKQLSGVLYKVIALNKTKGEMRIIFNSPKTLSKCYLNVRKLNDVNDGNEVEILKLFCNGAEVFCNEKYEFGPFSITKDEKIVLDVTTHENEYFGSEIRIKYAD